jgi:hypothetical protein
MKRVTAFLSDLGDAITAPPISTAIFIVTIVFANRVFNDVFGISVFQAILDAIASIHNVFYLNPLN